MTECIKKPSPFWCNMKYKQRDLLTRTADELSHYKLNTFPSKIVFLLIHSCFLLLYIWGQGEGGGREEGVGTHSPTNKTQYDNRTSIQWPTHYNTMLYITFHEKVSTNSF